MRYARQTVLADLGPKGQEALASARVLIVGVGGLGSPLSLYLAAAGVGTLGLVDADHVGLSNLQRQILFQTADVGQPKTALAKQRLEALNPDARCIVYPEFLDSSNALRIAADYDLIFDASDNFETKFLLNDLAVKLGKPLVYGSILRFEGQASIFWAERGPCYRCLFPQLPKEAVPNCAEAGVLGAMAGVIGSLQALEGMKLILALKGLLPAEHELLVGRFLSFDAKTMQQRIVKVAKDPDCPVCSRSPESIVLPDLDLSCSLVKETADFKNHVGEYHFLDVREQHEWDAGHIPGAEHWPLSKLRQGLFPSPQTRATVVYCQSGVRSRQAISLLKHHDWGDLLNLPEGFGAWDGAVAKDR